MAEKEGSHLFYFFILIPAHFTTYPPTLNKKRGIIFGYFLANEGKIKERSYFSLQTGERRHIPFATTELSPERTESTKKFRISRLSCGPARQKAGHI